MEQYKNLWNQLPATSEDILPHGMGYNEQKRNWCIDAIIYIPLKNGPFLFTSYLYCLWLTNRISEALDGNPLFKLCPGDLLKHLLMSYSPVESPLLKDIHTILLDNREHTLSALDAKLCQQYDRLPVHEGPIPYEEMKKVPEDNGDQLLVRRESIYDFGIRMKV
jgi:hypothetical protein